MRIFLLPVVLLLTLLAGCAEMVGLPREGGQPAAQAAAGAVTRSTEQGGRFIALVGPRRQFAEAFLGVPNTNFDALRSWVDTRSGERVNQLYVEDSYFGAQRNYDTARFKGGEPLKFVQISKNEITCDNGACSYAEEFAAVLPDAVLRAHPQGMTIVFTAKAGPEIEIDVPGDMIARQLAALDATAPAQPAVSSMSAVPPPSAIVTTTPALPAPPGTIGTAPPK